MRGRWRGEKIVAEAMYDRENESIWRVADFRITVHFLCLVDELH